ALAVGEWANCSGRALLTALILGYDVAVRLGAALSPRPLAHQNGQAPPCGPPPRAAAACSSRWWRLRPVTQPQAGAVSPPGAGLGRRPEAWGTAGCGEVLAGMLQETGLYISYTLFCSGMKATNSHL